MHILGIYDGHNTGVAYIEDGFIRYTVSEERLSRIKMHDGRIHSLPWRSLSSVLDHIPSSVSLDCIAISMLGPVKLQGLVWQDMFRQKNWRWLIFFLGNWNKIGPLEYVAAFFYNLYRKTRVIYMLYRSGLSHVPRQWVNHHLAHASSAYFTAGKKSATVCTLDGKGDGLCGSVYLGRNGILEKVMEISKYHSIGYLYTTITVGLGFKKMRHEGKITGLAAYGKKTAIYDVIKQAFSYKDLKFSFDLLKKCYSPPYPDFFSYKKLWLKLERKFPRGWKREDVAYAVQKITEEYVSQFVSDVVKKTEVPFVVAAGGLFANVRVNQETLKKDNVESFFVCPAMGDDGLAAGAALWAWAHLKNEKGEAVTPRKIGNVYLGPDYSAEEIKAVLDKGNIVYTEPLELEKEVANLLHQGKIVARFDGRMEWGPRALGNRSILYRPTDKSVNTWLNEQLHRTEFMPFAPVSLDRYTDKCYLEIKNIHRKKKDYDLAYMTMAVDCTDWFKERCPAVTHVDNTARPQVITKETNPKYYKIIEEYEKLSGIPVLVNTSFNMHEEPIVCSPEDATRSFRQGHLDYLTIGSYLISYTKQNWV